MFKVWRILSILILLSAYLLAYFFPQTASAASCTFTYNPVVPNQNMDKLTVTIKSSDLAANNYRIVFDLPNGGTHPKSSTASLPFDPTTGITVEFDKLPVNGWGAGKYKLFFIKSGESIDKAVCSTEFTIMDIPVSSSSCVTSIESKPIEPNTNVVLVIKDIENGTYD
ncbi:hypothetical protein HY384_01835, partial [Candidatus Daviesbacteria bacterium]|nr:hypothetical protein [Candidatus Daviesbacteria bacterium]